MDFGDGLCVREYMDTGLYVIIGYLEGMWKMLVATLGVANVNIFIP